MEIGQRLSKVLASAGVASRRHCEEIIAAGRAEVNGRIVLVPQFRVTPQDRITVDGRLISQEETKVYYILNKPLKYVCSAKGSASSRLVVDLFADQPHRLFTVGRLDKDTTGLLLVTNDGHFGNQVIHPSSNIEKEYVAKTSQELFHEHLVALSEGVRLDGVLIRPVRVQKVRRGTVKIVVTEGKKHEVRELLASAGLEVLSLARVRLGGLLLGTLPVGSWRPLTEREKELVFER